MDSDTSELEALRRENEAQRAALAAKDREIADLSESNRARSITLEAVAGQKPARHKAVRNLIGESWQEGFHAGYAQGWVDCLADGGQFDPLLGHLRDTMTAARAYTSLVSLRHAGIREALKPDLDRLRKLIQERYEALEQWFASRGDRIPDEIANECISLSLAIKDYVLGLDDGSALLACPALQHERISEIVAALHAVSFGGKARSLARDWIGDQAAKRRQNGAGTYKAVTKQIYRDLVRREGALTAIEAAALAALDERDGRAFRDHGQISEAAVKFVRDARESRTK